MKVENLAEYKERMLYAKEMGDEESLKKYYTLFCNAYKSITGKSFEEFINEEKIRKEIQDGIDEYRISKEKSETEDEIDR